MLVRWILELVERSIGEGRMSVDAFPRLVERKRKSCLSCSSSKDVG